MKGTSSQDLEHWIDQLRRLVRTKNCSAPQFIKPFHLVTLAHILREQKAANIQLPDKLSSYTNTMNLWGALKINPPSNIDFRQPKGRYHPIELLSDRNNVDSLSDDLVELFKKGNVDKKTLSAIGTMLRELIDNCYSHTNVEDGIYGAVCAQVWTSGGKAQIAIADNGVGIRNSLLQNPQLTEKLMYENGCRLATEYGITSKPGLGHSGYGLTVVRQLLEQSGGQLFVRSLDESFTVHGTICRSSQLLHHWRGTLLIIEWELEKKMNIRAVYDMLPLPEGMTNEDIDL